jgi:Suppressor of fused protein (SUFU)
VALMADPEVLRHVERYLGPRRRTHAAGAYAIADHEGPSMVSAVTDGLPSPATPLPVEFACSARPGQAEEAVRLVALFAELAGRDGAEVEYDDGFLGEDLLLPGTAIRGLLAAPHPYADEMFNLFRDAAGELRLQFVTLVPITGPEGRHLRDHETGELFDLWRSRGTDLLDLHRASAV